VWWLLAFLWWRWWKGKDGGWWLSEQSWVEELQNSWVLDLIFRPSFRTRSKEQRTSGRRGQWGRRCTFAAPIHTPITVSIAVAWDSAPNVSGIELADDVHMVEIALLNGAESHDCVMFLADVDTKKENGKDKECGVPRRRGGQRPR
jgi:hypothetical protein